MKILSIEKTIPRKNLKTKKDIQTTSLQQSETIADDDRKFILPMAEYMAHMILNK